jgi:hemerythrin-like domain-containing protein
MKSVEGLKAEHDLIERGLNLLGTDVARLEARQLLPASFPQRVPRFFQQFADQCHHAKEEDVFFPVLKQRGIPEQCEPIGVMLYEHDLGRDCVARRRKASQAHPFDARTFAEAARQYIPLLYQHFFKENNVLFRMAGRVMNEADDGDRRAGFRRSSRSEG